MVGIRGACSQFIGDLVQMLGIYSDPSIQTVVHPQHHTCKTQTIKQEEDLLIRTLVTVFGMQNNGRIKKEKARRVVENLGLVDGETEKSKFDLPGSQDEDEVVVEEALGGRLEEEKTRNELLWKAFRIFDEDGNGYIDAVELKRILECLGLAKGWDMVEVEKMLSIVDLNLDGKVDFGEFELMMGR